MPLLSVYFVRASLVYLLLGFSIGALMLANKGIMISASIWALLPVHIEFAFIGWMIQLTMGVGFWILPRFSHGPPRGDERLSWVAFVLVNIGILGIVIDSLFNVSALTAIGRITEMLGVLLFILGNWRRIKPFDT